ncbi:MAG: hypothetical protein J5701_00175 [Bacteroidales bacterium]|nr:hypothetical protein [Bacteroidales bacterium]
MEELNDTLQEQKTLIQEDIIAHVQAIGKWYKFFAVISIIGVAFMFICSIIMLTMGSFLNNFVTDANPYPCPIWLMGLIYLIFTCAVIPLIVFLMRASNIAQTLADDNNELLIANFLNNTRKYWKYYGIYTIVMLVLFFLIILGTIIVTIASMV